jgi:hypothetical protein
LQTLNREIWSVLMSIWYCIFERFG